MAKRKFTDTSIIYRAVLNNELHIDSDGNIFTNKKPPGEENENEFQGVARYDKAKI